MRHYYHFVLFDRRVGPYIQFRSQKIVEDSSSAAQHANITPLVEDTSKQWRTAGGTLPYKINTPSRVQLAWGEQTPRNQRHTTSSTVLLGEQKTRNPSNSLREVGRHEIAHMKFTCHDFRSGEKHPLYCCFGIETHLNVEPHLLVFNLSTCVQFSHLLINRSRLMKETQYNNIVYFPCPKCRNA